MEVVLGFFGLESLSGGGTYTLTVAEQLQRLGHEVTVFGLYEGEAADSGRERGLRIVFEEGALPTACDAVLAGDQMTSLALAERFPTAPQVFVMIAEEDWGFTVPPQVPGVVQAVLVKHDRVERAARALSVRPQIVRLRQPVDLRRFAPITPIRERPERVLLFGNYLSGPRRSVVEEVCADAGLECLHVGGDAASRTPEATIAEADIVIGKARTIVEAMACGRAAYVYDVQGGDGWVTPERYPLLEADNFGGQAEPAGIDAERFRADLAAYRPEMGIANRDLAVANHSAAKHVHALVELFERVGAPRPPPADCVRELARQARLQWATQAHARGLEHHYGQLQERILSAEAAVERQAAEIEELRRRCAELSGRLAEP